MSVIWAHWGPGKEVETRLQYPKNRGVIYWNINSIAVLLQKEGKNETKAQAQLVRRALFPLRRTVQFSPHWVAQKQQAGDSFVERIHAFLSLLGRLLLQNGYNYPAVPKYTNLIEQRNQCCTVLLYCKKKPNSLYQALLCWHDGPKHVKTGCKMLSAVWNDDPLAALRCVCVWESESMCVCLCLKVCVEGERGKKITTVSTVFISKKIKTPGPNSKTT